MANKNFDYDKVRDMVYDKGRDRYIGKDGSEFVSTMFSDGRGYKYDYYDKSTYNNNSHSGSHIKSDLQENWTMDSHNEDKSEWSHSSGTGCYLTSACLYHFKDNFDDDCEELTILRWFRDNFVLKEDIKHYYETAPIIVEAIDKLDESDIIYEYIYEHIVLACVEAIKNGDYEFAYNRYKNSILAFENQFARPLLESKLINLLRKQI